ncbi:MAG: SHOCT domain-containing protein [Pseudomonadota bacterium]
MSQSTMQPPFIGKPTVTKSTAALCAAVLIFSGSLLAQDDNLAAERGKIANQRIAIDAERQAEIEEKRRQAEAQRLQQQQAAAAGPAESSAAAPGSPVAAPQPARTAAPPDRANMQRILQLLRELGELKDAGYVTDEEFELLKEDIINSR